MNMITAIFYVPEKLRIVYEIELDKIKYLQKT